MEGRKKVSLNGPSQLTKMAIYGKNLLLQNQKSYDLETWCHSYFMLIGVGVHVVVSYLYVRITSVGEERANSSAIVYL